MKKQYLPVQVLPHQAPMLLLDEILDWRLDWIRTQVNRTRTALFDLPGGTASAMAALEYLCQSAAALAGIRQLEEGKPITIGFIIGARQFRVDHAAFLDAELFEIEARETFRDPGGIGLYAGRLYVPERPEQTIAEAVIKAAMPDDPLDVIRQTMLRPRADPPRSGH